jgi:hypothetical protein
VAQGGYPWSARGGIGYLGTPQIAQVWSFRLQAGSEAQRLLLLLPTTKYITCHTLQLHVYCLLHTEVKRAVCYCDKIGTSYALCALCARSAEKERLRARARESSARADPRV